MLSPMAADQAGWGWRRSIADSMPMRLLRDIRHNESPVWPGNFSRSAMYWHRDSWRASPPTNIRR